MEISEILEMSNGCIQDEKPYCTAACPLHVDVHSMAKHMQAGDYSRAYKLYAKQVMFPEILSRVCDEPCKNACIRNKLDEPISIRLLEKASVDFASKKEPPSYYVTEKRKTIHIVGGGLCGMSCAIDLARKGYHIELYEKTGRLGGKLWEIEESILPKDILDREIEKLSDENITFNFNTEITDIVQFCEDAVFVATGESGPSFGIFGCDRKINPLTLETCFRGVFAGGSILNAGRKDSFIQNILQGLQASRSIDRYLNDNSLDYGRDDELKRETRLYTNINGVGKKNAVCPANPASGFTAQEAKEEASRCLLCECMECVKNCIYLAQYQSFPQVYMKNFAGMMIDATGFNKKKYMHELNSCSMCGLCKEVCPTGVDMGKVVTECKKYFYENQTMPPAFHDFWLRDVDFSGSDESFLSFSQPGFQTSRYLFFPGCQLGASDPAYVQMSYQYLAQHLEGGVGIYLDCCGAPAAWAGNSGLFQKKQDLFLENWRGMGKPVVILACPSCSKTMGSYRPEVETGTLWRIIRETGLPQSAAQTADVPVAVYDPCSSRNYPEMQKDVRDLLDGMGYRVEELKLHGRFAQCCSYGGIISQANPALAEKIVAERINASTRNYITYCMNCRDDFAGKGKPTWHLLDLLFGRDDDSYAARTPPSRSERRSNRIKLKSLMAKEWCGLEPARNQKAHESIVIEISYEVLKKADERFILEDDIKQVIWQAEQTGYKFIRSENGYSIAHRKLGMVTYWVEYFISESIYVIVNVYSHRMELQESCNER